MVSQGLKLWWGKVKFGFRDWTHVIGSIGVVFGTILILLAALAVWYPSALPEDFLFSFTKENGRLDICSAGAGLLLLVFAGYYLADNLNNRRKFNRLFNIESKEKFIKNRDRIEKLAYYISTNHERMVQRKIREMKLR